MGTERAEKERAEEKKQEEKELLFLFLSRGGRRRRVSGHVRPQYGCGCVPQPNCGHPDEEVVITPTWGEIGVSQLPGSSPRPGCLWQTKASFGCCSSVCIYALLLYSNDVVIRVSDASPLYIFTTQYTYSTPLTILPSESCTLSALESGSTWYNRPTLGRPYCVVAASFRIYGFRRGWKIDLEKGLGFFYWC